MTPEQQTVAAIQAEIAKLRGSEQDIVQAYAHMFRTVIADHGLATLAFTLVGAEMATS
jgi:hypothetical protein